MKKCRKITDVAVPVSINSEQQFEGEGEERRPRTVSAASISSRVGSIFTSTSTSIVSEKMSAKEAGAPAPEPRTVKRTVEQLLAEGQIERCVEYGRAKKAEERKN